MDEKRCRVSTVSELLAAATDAESRRIVLAATLLDVPSLRLLPGQKLEAEAAAVLRFATDQDGLELSAENTVEGVELICSPTRRAVFNDTSIEDAGRIELKRLRVTGNVRLLACDRLRRGHFEAHDIEIIAADARNWEDRPAGYGVQVIPGAFTLWNQQADPNVRITADLTGLSAGGPGAPVRGSGIFVGGAGETVGKLVVQRLETEEIHSDGGIAPGTPDRISGGVFAVSGAIIDLIRNLGPVTTYGPNDMVLDNWGVVDRWIAEGKVTSFGPSGVGFVNFRHHQSAPGESADRDFRPGRSGVQRVRRNHSCGRVRASSHAR